MNKIDHLKFAALTLQKSYPKYSEFIKILVEKVSPFYLDIPDQFETQFVHLIAFQPKEKLKIILRDLLSLLGLQSETVLLWDNPDVDGYTIYSQIINSRQSHTLAKVLVTDFLDDVFNKYALEGYYKEVTLLYESLKERESLDLFHYDLAPSLAKKTLVLSILNSFGECDFLKTRLIFKFLLGKKMNAIAEVKSDYVPEELIQLIDANLLRKADLLFFSKDKPYHLKLALNLIRVHRYLEQKFTQLSDYPVRISYMAMDYFILFIYFKKLNYAMLQQEAEAFFLPLFHQIPSKLSGVSNKLDTLQIDFKTIWKFNVNPFNL